MIKSSSLVLSLALTAFTGVVPATAENFWIPSPDTGGGRKIHLEVSSDGSRRLEIAFVKSNQSAAGLNGTLVNVDNDEKPDVFNVTRYVNAPGMLRVTNDPGPNVRTATIFVSTRSDDYAWPLPVITNDNWFGANETAHLYKMARNSKGSANIEIMNFSPQSAVCSIQLLRPKGSAFGTPIPATVLALAHTVVKDPFKNVVTTGGDLRAEVTCNQPFYAYGTFVGSNLANFRMHYPLSAVSEPIGETVNVVRNGVFFVPKAGASALDLALPLVPEKSYRKVSIDFDVFVTKFTPIYTGLVGMFHQGGQRFNRTLYFGTFVRGLRARTLVDLGSPIVEPALRVSSPWKQNAMHHVTITYDAEAATTRMLVTSGGKTVLDASGGAYNLDIANRGNKPVRVAFGLPGVADGAYYPPIGWRFQNLKIKIEE